MILTKHLKYAKGEIKIQKSLLEGYAVTSLAL